ncbi:MAG TPA: LysM peptidoglycan-binding domain-containing protein [Anaerolineae bacterium]|nr:LysM peptidoglycan-binding domain-containing protein [Anaerolineae bacterium]HQH37979.1 LysM peptidoglycan-binding domain-containing protein [Anaerolineae bacterium]
MSIAGMFNPTALFTTPESLSNFLTSQEKAKIVTVDERGNELGLLDDRRVELEFQFNPASIKIIKEATWEAPHVARRNAPDLKFGGGAAATYDLTLVFDTSSNVEYRDVRMYTNPLLKLTMMAGAVDERKLPPQIKFQWGKFTLFLAVVTKVTIEYTLFDPDGTPIRAHASLDLKQQDDRDDYAGLTNPTTRTESRKTRVVRLGDRLDTIAYQEYGSPAYWRHLATANGLYDPRDLHPGQILILPPLP